MRKKIMAAVLLVALMVGSGYAGYAAAERPIQVVVNGNTVFTDTPPQIINGQVMVPLRDIAESLDKNVTWNPASLTVTIDDKQKKNTKPPRIVGPVEFVKDVQGALDLLKSKDVNSYYWVIANIDEIRYDTRESPYYAYTYLDTKKCFFNANKYQDIKRGYSKEKIQEGIAGLIAHESTHHYLVEIGMDKVLTENCKEAVCEIVSLSIAQKIDPNTKLFKSVIKAELNL